MMVCAGVCASLPDFCPGNLGCSNVFHSYNCSGALPLESLVELCLVAVVHCQTTPNATLYTNTQSNNGIYPSTATYQCALLPLAPVSIVLGRCAKHYGTSDPLTRTCKKDATWTGAAPRCSREHSSFAPGC